MDSFSFPFRDIIILLYENLILRRYYHEQIRKTYFETAGAELEEQG